MEEFLKNNLQLQVLTDHGWSDFDGLVDQGIKQTVEVRTQQQCIICTLDHEFFDMNFNKIQAKTLKPGFSIRTNLGFDKIVSVKLKNEMPVYDLINVEKNYRFYANDFLISNCKFIIFEETLINSMTLAKLEGKEPTMKMGQARWYKKINSKSTYIVSLDPSLGTGGDPAAIQVVEIPSMEQVAEWRDNTTPVQIQVRILRDMLKHIEDRCKLAGATPSIYYSIENNTLGEAALIALDALGEETYPGLFLSEPVRRGHVRKFRKGFNTTHLSKISACSKLKQLIETNKFKIHSKPLISELKTFIASGTTFKAKGGQHDDLVSSLLLNIRMIMTLQEWDPAIYDKMRDQDGLEDFDLPMPIYISTY